MAAKSSLLNMAACLTLICLVCSAILAGTNALTEDPIKKAQQEKTNASIARVLPDFSGDAVINTIDVDGTEYTYYSATDAGYAIVSSTVGFGGTLSLMVGIDMKGNVFNTSVLSHSETPGLGAKCQSDPAFIDQFKNWNPSEKSLKVKKDGGDVDAITASTITSRAYALAISNAVKVFEAIINYEGGEENE